ncbi:hypothetical protein Tco_1372401 [Tanacetum coccineum]
MASTVDAKLFRSAPNSSSQDEEEKIPSEGSLFPRSDGLGNRVVGSSSKNESVGLPVGTGTPPEELFLDLLSSEVPQHPLHQRWLFLPDPSALQA